MAIAFVILVESVVLVSVVLVVECIAIKKGKSSLSNSELLQSQILYSEENLAGKCRTVAIHIFPGYRAQGPGL